MAAPLDSIPGVGPKLSRTLERLGIVEVSDLQDKNPQEMYETLVQLEGKHVDRCVLYVFRCAVYYASHEAHEPDKLKWWTWKD